MTDNRLASAKVLMIIAPEQFRDEELLEPKRILTEAGVQVHVGSTESGEASGMLGAKVTPDVTIDKVASADYQAIVIVGGMGSPEHLWNNATIHKLLQECNRDQKVVAGICLSGAVLANAGVLKGKKATVWATPESLKALADGGAQYIKENLVQDNTVITADGPEAAPAFGRALVASLERCAAAKV